VDRLSLKPLTALGLDAPVVTTIGSIHITERFDVALASLASRRGREKDVGKVAKSAKLPLAGPSTLEIGKPYNSFWLSTEQWMVEADFANHEKLEAELKALFGDAASITEQTDAWVRFDVSAPQLLPLLERLCNVDFENVSDGFASRTVIEHIGCYLIKRNATLVTVYGPRSSAQSLLHVIETAAHSL
jgi:sarcosine oxidase, subunit gamma